MKDGPWYRDGIRFSCTQCGNCCVNHGEDYAHVYVTAGEIAVLARHLGLRPAAFRARYTRVDHGERVLTDTGPRCVFLDDRNRCSVYPARPRQCRTWPFWQENLDPETWEGPVKACCPGIGRGRLYTQAEIEAIADWTDDEDDDAPPPPGLGGAAPSQSPPNSK